MPAYETAQVRGLSRLPISLLNIVDEIPIGIVVLDTDRRVVMLNRALQALTGFIPPEAYGVPCWYVLRSSLCLRGCPIAAVSEHSEPVCIDANIVNRARQRIPVRVTAAPLLDLKGNLVGFIESVEDLRSLTDHADETTHASPLDGIIGRSPEIQRVLQVIPAIAQTDSSVLITGETGTGKDFVAEAIHQASARVRGPFVKINCGALPETLLESELFGHQKGAFTGAVENKPGRFRLAHNGTLYLTEIGDLPLNLQVKLLSFLDDRVLYPLGSTKGVQVDVRLIAATHRDLEQMVQEGRFRDDLLFRLNVVRLHLPRLTKRGNDVRLLLDHFLRTLSARFRKPVRQFDDRALEALLAYPFPGNVRELRNIVEYAVNVCDGTEIGTEHLPGYIIEHKIQNGERTDTPIDGPPQVVPSSGAPAMRWQDTERRLIAEAIMKARGKKSAAAHILGWGRSTLWRKMKRYGME